MAVKMEKKNRNNFFVKYLLTITASAVSETVTFPLDMIKTRLHIQGQDHSVLKSVGRGAGQREAYRGMFKTAVGVVKEEGFFRLWKGLSPAVLRHCIYSGCRVSFYELIRDHIFKRSSDGSYPLWKSIPTGMLAGAGGQFLASPTDRVKIIMQMEGKLVQDGHKPRYRGTWHAFRSIASKEGVRGLWKGWGPNCSRSALVCLGDLTTYDAVKQRLLKYTSLQDTAITHAMSSAVSGLTSALLGTPADVVKSRIMNQPYDDSGRGLYYRSSIDCLTKTVRGEGFCALYKGLVPIWSRMAPWSLTFWLVYEEIRVYAGVGNF